MRFLIVIFIYSLFLTTSICHADDANVNNAGRMSETEYVQDRTGKIIGSIVKHGNGITYVYDATGKIKGRCESGQTFDETGALISNSEIPGMLIDR